MTAGWGVFRTDRHSLQFYGASWPALVVGLIPTPTRGTLPFQYLSPGPEVACAPRRASTAMAADVPGIPTAGRGGPGRRGFRGPEMQPPEPCKVKGPGARQDGRRRGW